MATQTVRSIEVAYTPFYAYEGLEALTSTYKIGAFLTWNSNGQLTEAGADENLIVGVALGPGANKAASPLGRTRYSPLLPVVILEGNLVAGAASSHTVLEGTVIGLMVGIIKRTSESDTPWAFDASETTDGNQSFRIIGMRDASGDVNPRVYAVAIASKCAWISSVKL